MRTYSLRDINIPKNRLTIDFVLHEKEGPAASFAKKVSKGKIIGLSAPFGPNPMVKESRQTILIGDISALAAIEAIMSEAKNTHNLTIYLWLPDKDDLPIWANQSQIKVYVFIGENTASEALYHAIQKIDPLTSDDFIWVAGEASLVMKLRQLVRNIWQLPFNRYYAVPYWKKGSDEDTYHMKRHQFMEQPA